MGLEAQGIQILRPADEPEDQDLNRMRKLHTLGGLIVPSHRRLPKTGLGMQPGLLLTPLALSLEDVELQQRQVRQTAEPLSFI